jgi:UDP-glucose 4-epimerase
MILITGDKGYIGSRLKDALVLMGHKKLYGIDLKNGQDVLYHDLPKADVVYHLVAQAGVPTSFENPMWDARNNIMATIRIAERYPESRVIFTTSGAALEPESPYGLSKRTAEGYIRLLCKNAVIVRLSSVYGNKPKGVVDNFVRNKVPTVYGNGSAVRDFVHVDDVVRGLIKAKDWEPGTYTMGSGKGTSVKELADVTGKEIKYLPARPGEKEKVVLENTTPNWEPKVDVIEYIGSKTRHL